MEFGAIEQASKGLQLVTEMGRNLLVWKDTLEKNPEELAALIEDIERHIALLAKYDITAFLSEHARSTEQGYVCHRMRTTFELCRDKLLGLKAACEAIECKRSSFMRRIHPSTIAAKISDAQQKLQYCVDAISTLNSDMDELVNRSSKAESTLTNHADGAFKVVFGMVPSNPLHVVMDFSSVDSSGNPLTVEGSLKKAVFDPAAKMNVGAVARGEGGVGKTCALRAIGLLDEVKTRFPGGVLYIQMGEDSGLTQLIEGLADIVESAGGFATADKVRSEKQLKKAVRHAGRWFEMYACLFLIDDLWCVNHIDEEAMAQLSRIALHQDSRIVYSSRDTRLRGDEIILFEPREPLGQSSKAILLASARLPEPQNPDAAESFNGILNVCAGLPIALSLAGGSVRSFSIRECRFEQEKAWGMYRLSWNREEERKMSAILRRSVEVLHRLDESQGYPEKLDAFCILRKNQYLPVDVVKRLWGMQDQNKFDSVLENFGRFSIIRYEGRGCLAIGLHDILLDEVIRNLSFRNSSRAIFADHLIRSYIPQQVGSTRLTDTLKPVHLKPIEKFLFWFLKKRMRSGQPESISNVPHSYAKNPPKSMSLMDANVDSNRDSMRLLSGRWLTVHDDGYILANISWLLRLSERREELVWLMLRPRWIIRQFNANGALQVHKDIQLCLELINEQFASDIDRSECLIHYPALSLKWIGDAVRLSASVCRRSNWAGMLPFQLYGRLDHVGRANGLILRFLEEIVSECTPRPWLKPCLGFLPCVNGPLKHSFEVNGDILCMTVHENSVTVLSVSRGSKMQQVVYQQEFHVVNGYSKRGKVVWTSEPNIGNPTEPLAPICRNSLRFNGLVRVNCAAVSADGTLSVLGMNDGSIALIGTETKFLYPDSGYRTLQRTEVRNGTCTDVATVKHDERANGIVQSVAVSADGQCLAYGLDDGTVFLCELREGHWETFLRSENEESVRKLVMSAEGDLMSAEFSYTTVRVWERRNGLWQILSLPEPSSEDFILAVGFSAGRVASVSTDSLIRIWEQKDGRWEATVLAKQQALLGLDDTPRDYLDFSCPCILALSSNGQFVVSSGAHETLLFWRKVENSWFRMFLPGNDSFISDVVICENGRYIVSASKAGTILIWEQLHGPIVCAKKQGSDRNVRSVVMDSNGERIVSLLTDDSLWAWERVSGVWESKELPNHGGNVRKVVISMDGDCIASASWDHRENIRVWNRLDDTWIMSELQDHTGTVYDVAVSENGKRIASTSEDLTVRVWKVVRGVWESEVLSESDIPFSTVECNRDGRRVASWEFGKMIRVWEEFDGRWTRVGSDIYDDACRHDCLVDLRLSSRHIVTIGHSETIRVWGFGTEGWQCAVLQSDSKCISASGIDGVQNSIFQIYEDGSRAMWKLIDGSVNKWEMLMQVAQSDTLPCSAHSNMDGRAIKSCSAGQEGSELGTEEIGRIWVPREELYQIVQSLFGSRRSDEGQLDEPHLWRTSTGYFLKTCSRPFIRFIELEKQ